LIALRVSVTIPREEEPRMPWTAFDTAQPGLIRAVIACPEHALPILEDFATSRKPSIRLRAYGLQVAAYSKWDDHEMISDIIERGDAISPRIARAHAFAEWCLYSSDYIAQNVSPIDASGRLAEGLSTIAAAQEVVPASDEGLCIHRRRAVVHASLHTTRGLVFLNCYNNAPAAQREALKGLQALPTPSQAQPFHEGTQDMTHRAALSAVTIAAVTQARCDPTHLDRIEEEGQATLQPRHRIALARCRAYIAPSPIAAEIHLTEALELAVNIGARTEFQQTLAFLNQVRAHQATQTRWKQRWAALHE
jgi:hypothetical protein